MTEQDAIELARYQASDEGRADAAIRSIDMALMDLDQSLLTRDGLKAIRECSGPLSDCQDRLARIIERATPYNIAAE